VSQEEVEVSGEFREDGSCNAQTPYGGLASRDRIGTTEYRIGHSFNVAHRGFTLHAVSCAFPRDGNTAFSLNRRITALLGVRDGQSLRPGQYAIREFGVQDTTETQVTLAVSHPAYDVGTPGSGNGGSGGLISLRGVSGTLDLVRVDSTHVIGRFVMHARREWSM